MLLKLLAAGFAVKSCFLFGFRQPFCEYAVLFAFPWIMHQLLKYSMNIIGAPLLWMALAFWYLSTRIMLE